MKRGPLALRRKGPAARGEGNVAILASPETLHLILRNPIICKPVVRSLVKNPTFISNHLPKSFARMARGPRSHISSLRSDGSTSSVSTLPEHNKTSTISASLRLRVSAFNSRTQAAEDQPPKPNNLSSAIGLKTQPPYSRHLQRRLYSIGWAGCPSSIQHSLDLTLHCRLGGT